MNIGERIKTRREELGMSVESLAKKIGKSRATIYRYESGFIEKLPTDVLIPFAEALLTTPEYLMGWTDDVKPRDNPEPDIVKSTLIDIYNNLGPEFRIKLIERAEELEQMQKFYSMEDELRKIDEKNQ